MEIALNIILAVITLFIVISTARATYRVALRARAYAYALRELPRLKEVLATAARSGGQDGAHAELQKVCRSRMRSGFTQLMNELELDLITYLVGWFEFGDLEVESIDPLHPSYFRDQVDWLDDQMAGPLSWVLGFEYMEGTRFKATTLLLEAETIFGFATPWYRGRLGVLRLLMCDLMRLNLGMIRRDARYFRQLTLCMLAMALRAGAGFMGFPRDKSDKRMFAGLFGRPKVKGPR